MMRQSTRILNEVWNQENHASLFELCPENAHDLLDVVHAYKSVAPDLHFVSTQQGWSARGHTCGIVDGMTPTGEEIELSGSADCTYWDESSLLRQSGLAKEQFRRLRCSPSHEIRLRGIRRKAGVPIILFPALGLPGWNTWDVFIDVLQWRAPVVTFQMLGNRWSLERDSTPENYSLELETHAAFKAIRDAGVTGPLDLVGHSVGGALALNFALDHPEHVRSLTLIEPTAPWVIQPHSANISQFIQERIDSYQGQITPERYGAFLRKAMGPKYEPGRSRFWPSMCLYRNNMNYRPAFYNHSDDPCRLEATRFPVLLIAGSESLPFHHEIVEGLQNKLPKSELIVMPGNHAPHYGQGKDAFTSNLVRFLEGQS